MAKRKDIVSNLPATLIVKYVKEGSDGYFIADADISVLAELGEKLEVGVYDLREIRTLTATPELNDPELLPKKMQRGINIRGVKISDTVLPAGVRLRVERD